MPGGRGRVGLFWIGETGQKSEQVDLHYNESLVQLMINCQCSWKGKLNIT